MQVQRHARAAQLRVELAPGEELRKARLGLGLDDLIEGYIQTILTMTAIDEMAIRLVNTKGKFRRRFFATLNPDPALIREIDWLDPHADALPATKEDS